MAPAKIIQNKKKPPQSIDPSVLLAALFENKDPSWSQLTRIIKKKENRLSDFPMQEASLSDFHVPGKSKELFSEEERALLSIEAKNKIYQREIENLKQKLVKTEKDSFKLGKEEGKKEGLREGYDKAKSEMDSRITSLQKQAQSLLQTVEKEKQGIYHQAESLIAKMIMAFVAKIISVESKTNPEVVAGVTKKALKALGETQKIAIKVHPTDTAKVKEELPLWLPINQSLQNITVEEDGRIERGGCIIYTDSGQIDARLDTQQQEMLAWITRIWQEEKTENP
jgi:flagellar assembly protein FliH